jgi:hypothetical protein
MVFLFFSRFARSTLTQLLNLAKLGEECVAILGAILALPGFVG